MDGVCCDLSRLSASLESALGAVYLCKRRLLQLAHSSRVDQPERKFTNVYPFRGGLSKILPVRSTEKLQTPRLELKATAGIDAEPCPMNSQDEIILPVITELRLLGCGW